MKKLIAFFTLSLSFQQTFAQVGTVTLTPNYVCTGTNVTAIASGFAGATITRWEFSATNGPAWTAIGGSATATFVIVAPTTTQYYRAVATTGSTPTNSALLTVDAASTGTVTASATVCSGVNGNALTLTGTHTAINYWEFSTNGGGAWTPIANTTNTESYSNLTTTTLYRANVTNGICPAANSTIATITVNSVSVGGTTAGSSTVCPGSNSGTLSLTGYTGTIQWQNSTTGGSSWANIAGATANTVNYANLTQTTDYRAVVTNGVCAANNSTSVTITVTPASVGGTTAGAATVCSGTNSGNITLSGHTGTIVRWESSPDGNSWSNIANTTTSQSYSNLTASTYYRVLIQSGSCATAYSTNTIITVSQASAGGTVSGTATECAGTNSGTLSLSGYTGSIQWQSSTTGGVSWANITGATSNTYSYLNLTQTTDYRAVVTSSPCPAASSSSVTVTITPVSVGGSVAGAASVCAVPNSGNLTLSGHTGTIIRWEYSTNGGANWTNIANTTAVQTYSNVPTTTDYRVLVQSGACAADYSNNATLTVSPASVGGIASGSVTACAGSNSGTLTLSGYTGSIIRWQSSTDGGVTWTNIAGSANSFYNYSNLTVTTDFRANVQSGSCAVANSSDVTVTIFPVSVGGTVTSNATVCSGANNGTLLLTGYAGNVIQWEKSIDNGANWTVIANTTDTISYTNLTVKTLYKALVQSGACASKYSTTATININLATAGGNVSGSDTVCSGANSGTLLLSGYVGSIVRWQSSVDGGVTWTNINNTTAVLNYSNLTATTNYRAVVQSGTCPTENSTEAIITVFPISVGGTVSSNATVCSGFNNGTLLLTGYTGSVVRWEKSINNGFSWTQISNNTDTISYSNLNVKTLYRALVQSGACASKYSTVATINVNASSAGGAVSGTDTICSGSNSGTLILSGYVGSIVRWQFSTDGGVTWTNVAPNNTTAILNYANITTTTTYRAVVQNGSCPTANSTEATITVLPLSVGGTLAPVSFNACASSNSGTIVLSGESGNVTSWQSSTDGGVTWTSITNTTTTQNFQNISVTTKYRAIVQNGLCTPAYSAISTINVFPATVGGSIAGGDTVCTGTNNGSLTLTSFTGSVLNWEASTDGGVTWLPAVPTNSTAIHNYTNLATTTMFRAVVQSGSCPTANSTVGTILVNPATVGGNILGGKVVCDSLTSGLLTLNGNTGSVLNWQYSTNGGITWTTVVNTSSTYTFTNIKGSTLYRVNVQSGICAPAISSTATVSLASPANASYNVVINGATVTFTNTSTSNGGTSSWSFGDGTTSTITSPVHTYTANGTYVVQLNVSDSCGGDSTTQTVIITGVGISELVYNNGQVNIYPNPFNETATLEITGDQSSVISKEFILFDMYGKEVYRTAVTDQKSIISRGTLPAGLYFYKLQSPDETIATGKIMIQ